MAGGKPSLGAAVGPTFGRRLGLVWPFPDPYLGYLSSCRIDMSGCLRACWPDCFQLYCFNHWRFSRLAYRVVVLASPGPTEQCLRKC